MPLPVNASESESPAAIAVTVPVSVPYQRIADLIVGAVEGGSVYWCASFRPKTSLAAVTQGPWYSDPKFYADSSFVIEVVENEPSAPNSDGRHLVNHERLVAGLQIMAEKYAGDFGDFMRKTDDAGTADVFLQCIALGEVVYG